MPTTYESSLTSSLIMCCYLHGIIYVKVNLTFIGVVDSVCLEKFSQSFMLFRNCKMESNHAIFRNICIAFHFKI
jgi:hypothetical protein